jgi:ferritin-like metal-binding protein YciE
VAIIFTAQKAEHYKIATYGCLVQLANTLGFMEAKNLLGKTLEEEKRAVELLSQIAESGIHYQENRKTEHIL